jgi:UDP-N-acetylmuramate dehydrogenase
MRAGLSGLEHISGIPGSLGGLIYMNGGSLRRSISEAVASIKVLSNSGTSVIANRDCGFRYRHSALQANGAIVMGAELRLTQTGDPATIRREMLKIMRARAKKFPRKTPNCGSVFISDEPIYEEFGPPGKVLEDLGLKGTKVGGAEISTTHANFIINHGGATAEDVFALIALVRQKVLAATGYVLRVEPKFVAANGSVNEI